MSYVDKVAVGGTTYDIQDTKTKTAVNELAESVQEFENTGLVMINGKLCVKVERS